MPFKKGSSGNPTGAKSKAQRRSLLEIQQYAQIKTIEMLNIQLTIARNEKLEPEVRLKATELVLNRAWGRPEQPVSVAAQVNVTVEDARRELEDRILKLIASKRAREGIEARTIRALPGRDDAASEGLEAVGETGATTPEG